jgi:RimJ/RimL family protein N-acetyltransferase
MTTTDNDRITRQPLRTLRLVAGTVELYDAELAEDRAELARLLEVDLIAEWPPIDGEHDQHAVTFFRESLDNEPSLSPWLAFYVCVGAELVGSAGFMGPPADGTAEIGYSICQRCRGRGYATGAVGALMERAWEAGVRRIIAQTKPTNRGSIIVLERNGFARGPSERYGYLRFVREPDAVSG